MSVNDVQQFKIDMYKDTSSFQVTLTFPSEVIFCLVMAQSKLWPTYSSSVNIVLPLHATSLTKELKLVDATMLAYIDVTLATGHTRFIQETPTKQVLFWVDIS